MMNRQIRRAQAKQDKKAEREKEERREARKRKVAQMRAKRAERRTAARSKPAAVADEGKGAAAGATKDAAKGSTKGGKKPGRRPGRFSGALMMATIFFIVLQSSVPPMEGDNELLRSFTGAGFFLLFGYFSVMWLMRRDTPRPLMMTWITGALLLVGVEVAKALQGVVPFDPLMVALAAPGIVGGSYLGRLVFENTPA
ncbi:MAG: hypothetical protein R6T93_03230 [Trueperaceae bacterium]